MNKTHLTAAQSSGKSNLTASVQPLPQGKRLRPANKALFDLMYAYACILKSHPRFISRIRAGGGGIGGEGKEAPVKASVKVSSNKFIG